MAAIGSTTLASCGSDSQNQTAGQTAVDSSEVTTVAGPQPLLDSTEVIKSFQTEPKFKAQLLPARRF